MNIVIANIGIRQDKEGRYCLNDLHKAAGGESRHQLGHWLALAATNELVSELDKNVKILGKSSIYTKQGLGTFACLELVYDYAAWISPAFKLDVYRTFHSVKTQTPVSELKSASVFQATKAHLAIQASMVLLGVRPEMAMAATLRSIHLDTGLSVEAHRLALPAVEDPCTLNQGALGALCGLNAKQIGDYLRRAGLLAPDKLLTDEGKKWGEMRPYQSEKNGHAGYQPLWKASVLDHLNISRVL